MKEKSKVKIETGLKDEPESFKKVEIQPTPEWLVFPGEEKLTKPAYVCSTADHPITASYDGRTMMVPPRARLLVANSDLVGALPRHLTIVPAKP
jgi:hypothetical protein